MHQDTRILEEGVSEVLFSEKWLADKLPKSEEFEFVWKFLAKIKSRQTPPKTIARANEIKHKQLKDVRCVPPAHTNTIYMRTCARGGEKWGQAAQCVSVTCP